MRLATRSISEPSGVPDGTNIPVEFGRANAYSRAVGKLRIVLLLLTAVTGGALPASLHAASARLVKVLPQFIDQQGRVALNPSLYERDAYQAHLRSNPEERAGLSFAVQWKSRDTRQVRLRLELRGNRGRNGTTALLEETVRHRGLFGSWSRVKLTGDAYKNLGELSAWRATLWDGETLLAEQKSFLW